MKKVVLLSFASIAINANANSEAEELKSRELEEIVVNATKAGDATPMAFTNVSKEELKKNSFGQDVPYLISQTPNVIVTSDAGTGIGYTGFRVRGTDAGRINITVNGVPMNDPESQNVFWVNMSDFSSSVENVQIQRGVGTSTNGSAAFGATIGMQTAKPNLKPYAEVNSAAGSFSTFKNTVSAGTGLINDHFVVDARYSKIDSKGFIDRAKADMSSYYASAAYYGKNFMLRYISFGSSEVTNQAWNYVPSDSIKAGNRTFNNCGEYFVDRLDENGNKVLDEDGNVIKDARYYDQSDNYWQYNHHLSYSQNINNNLSMNLTVHYTNGKGYYEDYKADASLYKFNLTNFVNSDGEKIKRTDLIRRKWMVNDFYGAIYNLNYNSEKLNMTLGAAINNYEGNHFGHVIWAKNYNNLGVNDRYYDNDGNKLDYNAFIKANFNLTSSFSIFADMQYRGIKYTVKGTNDKFDYDKVQQILDVDKTYDFFNPKAGINYSKNGHNAFASFAMANREPSRNNFTDALAKERPTYETLYDYEAGYSYNGKCWNIGANLYYMDYKNQLIQTGKLSEIGEALTSNIKESYRAGIEMSAGVKIANFLTWRGNISFSENKIKNLTETVDLYELVNNELEWLGTEEVFYKKTDISFSPDIVANSIFDFNVKGFYASLMSSYVGRQYLDNTGSKDRSLDPYFVNNLQFGYSFRTKTFKEIGLNFRVNNLFNTKYETSGWVYSYAVKDISTLDNRSKDDGLATQAGTNFMGSLTLKF